MTTRRFFLKSSGLALVAFGVAPRALVRAAYAGDERRAARRRWSSSSSAAPATASTRWSRTASTPTAGCGPTIALPRAARRRQRRRPRPRRLLRPASGARAAAAALDGRQPGRRSTPSGSPDPTRSHFDAQDFMESGTPGRKATEDGWMNRAPAGARRTRTATPFRAVVPHARRSPARWRGRAPAVAMTDVVRFELRRPPARRWPAASRTCTKARCATSCTAPAQRDLRRHRVPEEDRSGALRAGRGRALPARALRRRA